MASAGLSGAGAEAGAALLNGLFLGDADAAARSGVEAAGGALPFGFLLGGRPFGELVADCERTHATEDLGDGREKHVFVWALSRPSTFSVRCEAVRYRGFPHVEWTITLKNDGTADTPVISELRALDVTLGAGTGSGFTLHHNNGSPSRRDDYAPRETPLPPGATARLGTDDGRPSHRSLPYFNIARGEEGLIVAVGWPGQWFAFFETDDAGTLRLCAGQEDTHFVLHPGESFRTPLIVLQPWRGDRTDAQNVWRRWMMEHNLPRIGGRPPKAQLLATSSGVYFEMVHADEASQRMFIDRYVEEGIPLDCWWMDAGWYPNADDWKYTGTWEVDRKRFPNGLRAVSDHAHEKGLKALVWFEPERVAKTTWLEENRPEWILRSPTFDPDWGSLLNLGDPEVYDWVLERIDSLIVSEGIDIYRQDFNIPPLTFWRAADTDDRRGITEQRYVVNFLRFWDELRCRHPDLLIDDCASGGRRLDLETLRRSVPLWRSDYAMEPVGQQCQTHNLNAWLPYSGTGTGFNGALGWGNTGPREIQPYAFWSNAAPSLVLSLDMRDRETDYQAARRLVLQWRSIAADYTADYYPLLTWTDAPDAWVAWQFNRPETGTGFVQAMRRPESPFTKAVFRLRGLVSGAMYRVWNVETPDAGAGYRGGELMETGLGVDIPNAPGVAVFAYRRAEA
jgi:alpha-galactosidase